MPHQEFSDTTCMTTASKLLRKIHSYFPEGLRFSVSTFRQTQQVKKVLSELKTKRNIFVKSDASTRVGINLFGFLTAGLGLGEAARSTIRGAHAVGLPVSLFDIRLESHPVDASLSVESAKTFEHGINLFHFNPDSIGLLLKEPLKTAYLRAHYNIGFWFWETTRLPDQWALSAGLFDEIWVASSFCESTVLGQISKPVTRIPLNVASPEPDPFCGRKHLGLPEKGFLFLTLLDCYSTLERKNPTGVLHAFEKAFEKDTADVFLIVKVINRERNHDFEKVLELIARNKHVIMIDTFLNRSQLYSLISEVDCLVSLHRAEGFGLPIVEAMSMAKPVIATAWSANLDFQTAENSFLIPYDMTVLDSHAPPYPKGTSWADPDIEEAANVMSNLVNHPDLCRKVGNQARADINSRFSAAVTGQKILERLTRIHGNF